MHFESAVPGTRKGRRSGMLSASSPSMVMDTVHLQEKKNPFDGATAFKFRTVGQIRTARKFYAMAFSLHLAKRSVSSGLLASI